MNTATAAAIHTAHVATLAAAHTNCVRATELQSAGYFEEASVRNALIARAQRKANKDGATCYVVSRSSQILAVVEPQAVTIEESDESMDFANL